MYVTYFRPTNIRINVSYFRPTNIRMYVTYLDLITSECKSLVVDLSK